MKPKAANRLQDLHNYFFADVQIKMNELKKQGKTIINLGIGEPDLPPAPEVVSALQAALVNPLNHRYPQYYGSPALRQAVSQWYLQHHQVTVDETAILPVNGSKQAIAHLTLALINPGDEVLLPNPGYASYERATLLAGGTPRWYELSATNNYLPNLKQLAHTDLSRVKLMWINYPHNPTGATAQPSDLEQILRFTQEHDIILVSDSPYTHVTYTGHPAASVLEVGNPTNHVLELQSLSKTYNIPGWRLGWLAGNQDLIKLTAKVYSNMETGIFPALQEAAITALALPSTWIAQRNQEYARRIPLATKILESLGCELPLTPTATLYLWAKVPETIPDIEQFCFEILEQTGVFLTPGTVFGSAGAGCVRISLCQPQVVLEQAYSQINAFYTFTNQRREGAM